MIKNILHSLWITGVCVCACRKPLPVMLSLARCCVWPLHIFPSVMRNTFSARLFSWTSFCPFSHHIGHTVSPLPFSLPPSIFRTLTPHPHSPLPPSPPHSSSLGEVLTSVVLFIKVLERFGWLADDYGGKRRGPGDVFPRRAPTCCWSFCSLRRALLTARAIRRQVFSCRCLWLPLHSNKTPLDIFRRASTCRFHLWVWKDEKMTFYFVFLFCVVFLLLTLGSY